LIASACDLKERLRSPERASKHRTIASPQPVKTNLRRRRRMKLQENKFLPRPCST
jgi:hypothetical protein